MQCIATYRLLPPPPPTGRNPNKIPADRLQIAYIPYLNISETASSLKSLQDLVMFSLSRDSRGRLVDEPRVALSWYALTSWLRHTTPFVCKCNNWVKISRRSFEEVKMALALSQVRFYFPLFPFRIFFAKQSIGFQPLRNLDTKLCLDGCIRNELSIFDVNPSSALGIMFLASAIKPRPI